MQKVDSSTPKNRKRFRFIREVASICLLLLSMKASVVSAAKPEETTFPGGKHVLLRFLYKPLRSGPFPTILYNHESEKRPESKLMLGEFFSSKGYLFFVHRRGHMRSPHDSFVKSLDAERASGRIALHETHLEDQLAALANVKKRPDVDPSKIAVASCS